MTLLRSLRRPGVRLAAPARVVLCALALSSPVVQAQSQTPVQSAAQTPAAGVVKRVTGDVQIQRGTAAMGAQPGTAVQVGDVVRTGPGASAGITLADDTLLAAGPQSELVVTAFDYNPTTTDGNLLLSLWRGVVSVVTGTLGQSHPEKVRVQTRTVVLGVRGTEFIVDAGQGGAQP